VDFAHDVMQRIFFDHNSTTRPLPEVIDAISVCSRESFANPGSQHAEGRVARRALEDARERIAAILGAKPGEVIFTSGGTESINLAILGLAADRPGTVLLTAGEHAATREACGHLERHGWKRRLLDVDSEGRIIQDRLDDLPWSQFSLATLILAHNETGVIQDAAPLALRCAQFGVPLHLDAVQAIGKMPVHFQDLNAAALSLAAHKFHGPRGIGAVLLREGISLRPRQLGGHQEAERRAGTESVSLAIGMAVALERWLTEQTRWETKLRGLQERLERGLTTACDPIVINGSREHRLPNTSNVAFPGVDGEALRVALDLAGIACSLGSTCASGSTELSPALLAMGCPPEIASCSVRFSLSFENTLDEVDEAVRRIALCVARLRRSSVPAAVSG
jgi:cysteine desulfurase